MANDHVLVWLVALAIVMNGRVLHNVPRAHSARRIRKK
jgi:hypothetical protein